MKPLIAVTSGDPLGIGPEVTVKALEDKRIKNACRMLVIGERTSLLRAEIRFHAPFFCIACENRLNYKLKLPGPDKTAGEISYKAVRLAVRLALDKMVDAVVTAPICKESWALAKTGVTGHTELLRAAARAPEAAMIFISGRLRVALATEHLPMVKMPKALKPGRIISTCETFNQTLKRLGINRPKLVLCALNPHAGDGGALGNEEIRILKPSVKILGKKGINVEGPVPGDCAWMGHIKGKWDGLVAVYHDQALTALKVAAQAPIVHWTYGLPFIRTSPAHGTAFDIAGKGTADPSSMIEAILFAVKLTKR